MPIQNIQSLVDKNGLTYIGNENYITKYYNEALANLGQRNTNDSLLKYESYSFKEIYKDIIDNDYFYEFGIYNGTKFYTLNKESIENDGYNINIIEDLYEVIKSIETDIEHNIYCKEITLNISELDINDNKYILCNSRLNIIDSLWQYINKDGIICNNLWIPINDKNGNDIKLFGYVSNGINNNIIYNNFKDIFVNIIPENFYVDTDDYELEDISFYKTNIFYFKSYQTYVNTNVYQYSINNNDVITELKFTLPYIDEDDYWNINNVRTNIQAKAHDAINLNIILAYYYKKANNEYYKFLSGINNINTNNLTLISKEFKIKNNNDILRCVIKVPKISQNNITKENAEAYKILANSNLIIIAKITDIIIGNENLEKYGNGYVTTIWKYNIEDESYSCICIDEDTQIALDFNILTNFENLLNYEVKQIKQVEPDNYLFSQLIFDEIYYSIKQENNNTIYSYPVLQNLQGIKYNNKYINNLNFSLKYINNIVGEPGKNIYNIAVGTDNKYLKTSTNNYVTNTLYQYIENNKINYYNEYIPNYNLPVFDMSEFFVKDINTMNKYNIISFDYNGEMYYSYLGTSKDTAKNILTLGTSTTNINIGENTLANQQTKQNFKTQNAFNINFDTINVNGLLKVNNDINITGKLKINKFEWNSNTINNKEILSTSFIPQFKYYIFGGNNYIILNISNINQEVRELSSKVSSQFAFGTLNAKYNLFISVLLSIKSKQNNLLYYYKYNDLLVLKNLIRYLDLDLNDVITIESNTNDIIKIDGNPVYLVSSNSIISDNFNIVSATDTGISIDISNNSEYYFGNMLYITYIPSDKKLIVNEIQSNKIKSIWKIPTNI